MSMRVRQQFLDEKLEPVVRAKGDKWPVQVETGEESKVQQHFKDLCDINKIIPSPDAAGNIQQAQSYGDFSDIFDFAGNLQKWKDAEMAFSHLPPALKKKLGNKPEAFMAYLTDPSNIDECLKYGFIEKDPRPKPENHAPQATKSGKLKKTTTVVEESADE